MEPFQVLRLSHEEIKKHDVYAESAVELYKASFDTNKMFNNADELTIDKFLDECLSLFEPQDVSWWLLVVDEELVSIGISANFDVIKEYFIYNLCTHPTQRSKGYAKYLMFEIQKFAMNHDIIGFKGNVDLENVGAIAFYTKYGAYKDENFSKSDPNNPATFMRLLYRWNDKSKEETMNIINRNQGSVLNRYKYRNDRPHQMKHALTIFVTCSILYCLYRNWNKNKVNQ